MPVPPTSATPSKKTTKKTVKSDRVKADLSVVQTNDNYLITLNHQSYELNESQYKAIMRKKDMPVNRLEVWLKAYAEENN